MKLFYKRIAINSLILCVCLICLNDDLFAFVADAKGFSKTVKPFMRKYCYDCHGSKKQKGDLRLDILKASVIEEGAAAKWIEVLDSMSLGEMPPEDEKQPKAKELEKVMIWLSTELNKARRHLQSSGGRVTMRRLNRQEYANTIEDLFDLKYVNGEGPLSVLSPEGKIDGFTKLSKALMFNPGLMQNYYQLAVDISNKVIVTKEPYLKNEIRRFELEKMNKIDLQNLFTEATDKGIKLYSKTVRTRNQLAHSYNRKMIPALGRYTVRIKAGAFKGNRKENLYMKLRSGGSGEIKQWEVKASDDDPQIYEVTLDMAPAGNSEFVIDLVNGSPFSMNNRVWSTMNSKMRKLIEQRKVAEAEDLRSRLVLEGVPAFLGTARPNPDILNRSKMPHLFIDYIEIEGPLGIEWPPKSMVRLFPEGYESSPKDLSTAKDLISKLLRKAFRKPVVEEDLQSFIGVFKDQKSQGKDFAESMKSVIQAILCSPEFLYIIEPNGDDEKRKLDHNEFAARLSYFLWSSMPDESLMKAASKSNFKARSNLDALVDAMLKDEKSQGFYEGFVKEWLKIEEFDNFMLDKRIYKDFFSKEYLGISEDMKQEPVLFVKQIIEDNSSMLDLLKSDWTMLNQKMAKYYGIEGIEHLDFRKVKLPKGSYRGGLVTMAGFHKWGSDGNRTKPVERGKYVLDVLFNSPAPPPPPNAGEVEPNTNGENLSVRDRLLKHQTIASCAVCHKKIDPYGLGLENFNVVGKWRDLQDGESFRKDKPKIITEGKFPNGASYKSFEDYRHKLYGMKDRLVRGLTEKMLTYALGRTIEPSDKGFIEDMMKNVKKQDYSMRSLIKEIVASEVFNTK